MEYKQHPINNGNEEPVPYKATSCRLRRRTGAGYMGENADAELLRHIWLLGRSDRERERLAHLLPNPDACKRMPEWNDLGAVEHLE